MYKKAQTDENRTHAGTGIHLDIVEYGGWVSRGCRMGMKGCIWHTKEFGGRSKGSREQLKDWSWSVIRWNKSQQRVTLTALWGVDPEGRRLKAARMHASSRETWCGADRKRELAAGIQDLMTKWAWVGGVHENHRSALLSPAFSL